MSTPESPWKSFFAQWPEAMAHRGIVITSLNEAIPFNGFMTSDRFVVISRNAPDALGARTVALPYESLVALKLTDIVKSKAFQSAGFHGELGHQ